MLPFLVVILGGVAYFSARQSPHLGLHGKSLALSAGLAGFVAGALGVRQTLLQRPRSARAWGPFKLALYRVTQEALTNIRKHAHPERVEVRLEYLRDGVSLAVEDFVAAQDNSAPGAARGISGGG